MCRLILKNYPTEPGSPPDNVESVVLSSTSIAVTWEEVPPIEQNGIIIVYEVLYEPLETFGGILVPSTVNTTDLEAVIMNLTAFVSYNISIRAYTCLLYTSPSPRDATLSRMPSSA